MLFYAEFQEFGGRWNNPSLVATDLLQLRQAKSVARWVFGNASVRQTPKKRYAAKAVDARWWDDLWVGFHLAICINSLFSWVQSTGVFLKVLWLTPEVANAIKFSSKLLIIPFAVVLLVQYVLGWQLTIVDPKFSSSYLPAISCLLQMFIPQEILRISQVLESCLNISIFFNYAYQGRIKQCKSILGILASYNLPERLQFLGF